MDEQETSLRDDLKAAMQEVKETETPVDEPKEEPVKELQTTEEPVKEPIVEEKKEVKDDAPAALSAAAKAKWNDLPPEIKSEWSKREADIHKMFTSHDGELRLGRELKDVITPYMPIIQAEGGTPAKAVQELLNTAYVLRTGNPYQKAQILQQVAETYGIDMSLLNQQQQYVDPTIQQLQQQIAHLSQVANPDNIQRQLQERLESAKIESEIDAFAADTKNAHFNNVKPQMAVLLDSGQAKSLQEAYDMACWANPTIRSTLMNNISADEQAKRKSEIEAKKKAAVSVTGSPGVNVPNTGSPDRTLRDELRAQIRAHSS